MKRLGDIAMVMGYAKAYIQKKGLFANRKLRKITNEKSIPLKDIGCDVIVFNYDPPNVSDHLKLVLKDLDSTQWDFDTLVLFDLDDFGEPGFVQDFINQVHERGVAVYSVKTSPIKYMHVNFNYKELNPPEGYHSPPLGADL